jgi:hypothetical protein
LPWGGGLKAETQKAEHKIGGIQKAEWYKRLKKKRPNKLNLFYITITTNASKNHTVTHCNLSPDNSLSWKRPKLAPEWP